MSHAEFNAPLPQPPSEPVRGTPRPARAGGSELAPSDPVKTGSTPPYLTAAQLATLFVVDDATIYRWAATDASMPVTRVGGVVRFNRLAIERWLASKTQKSRR